MIVHECEQYSPEWWQVRAGLPTASAAAKIVTPTGTFSKQSDGLINALIADSLGLGDPPMEPTEWMERGKEMEAEARKFFTFETGLSVREVGFITNDDRTAGCSPDGLIPNWPDDPVVPVIGGLEIKCPKASTQIGYLRAGQVLPATYVPQVHWSLAVTGLPAWWFLSYHPELDPVLVRVERDDYTEKMATAIGKFAAEMKKAKSILNGD